MEEQSASAPKETIDAMESVSDAAAQDDVALENDEQNMSEVSDQKIAGVEFLVK